MPELLWENATFAEADIRVDAILSFPWLVRTKIGVFPHLRALALAEPEMTLLMGLPKVRRYGYGRCRRKMRIPRMESGTEEKKIGPGGGRINGPMVDMWGW